MKVSTPEIRIAAFDIALPAAPVPVANDAPYSWVGNLLFLSGQGPRRRDGGYEVRRLGKDATGDDGHRAARLRSTVVRIFPTKHRGKQVVTLVQPSAWVHRQTA
jgi:hypothetical protein